MARTRTKDTKRGAQQSLRARDARLRVTYERAPVGMFETDLHDRFAYVNDEFCALAGRSRNQLLLLRVEDITHPDDRAAEQSTFERLTSGAVSSLQFDSRYIRGDGSVIGVQLRRFLVVAGANGQPRFTAGIAEDITERKETETAARQRDGRFRRLMDSAPALIWMHGLEGMEFVNQAYLELVGAESKDVLGFAWMWFVHPDDRAGYAAAYDDAVAELQPFEHQFRLRRADGEYRWVMSSALPQFGAGGRFCGYMGSTFDVTVFRGAEEALRTADQRKDAFIATLAHELRNPLAPIANVAELLATTSPDANTIAWAHTVLERQLRTVSRLVSDLLDVSRIAHDKVDLQREPLDLSRAVGNVVDAIRPTLQADRKQITVELPASRLVLFADPIRMEQILGNLLSNAIKFSPPEGHVWLTATVAPAGDEVAISVRDDGDGMDAETLPHIFEMFAQANRSLARHGGLGIGLTLVRRLVELHGGTVQARSAGLGRGSEFVVRLPLERDLASPAADQAAPQSVMTAVGARRILVVDDHVDAANALAVLLRQQGHTVTVAHGGEAALAAAKEFVPEVALLDLGMPGLSGFDVGRLLRRQLGAEVFLVAVSGYSGTDYRRGATEAGIDEYVVKPLDVAALDDLLIRRSR